MARKMIAIQTVKCPRCGKTVSTMSRSLYGADDLKKEFEGLCQACVTPEEQNRILQGQAKAIINSYRQG